MIKRKRYIEQLKKDLQKARVVALLGPRQCGKTTLALEVLRTLTEPHHFFDLENPRHAFMLEDPTLAFESLNGLIVIDEVQRKPDLFPLIRYLVDHHNKRFLILGSASQHLLKQSSESLAGRIRYREVTPLSLTEVDDHQSLWFRGGYPLAYLEDSDQEAQDWSKDYIKTFLEVDIPAFGLDLNPLKIRKFWMMLAHYHSHFFNASELSRGLDISYKSAQHYLDILQNTFMIRALQPWFANIGKRQVKTPKIYFRDSGLYHSLLGVNDRTQLVFDPNIGASFEGFAIEELIRFHRADPQDCAFWSTHSGAELDLLLFPNSKKLAFEIKYSSIPKVTKSMRQAIHDLELDLLTVIIPGEANYKLDEKIRVLGLKTYIKIIEN